MARAGISVGRIGLVFAVMALAGLWISTFYSWIRPPKLSRTIPAVMNGVEQLLPADPAVSNLIDDKKIATVEQQSAVQPTGAAVPGAMAQQASAEVKAATDTSSTESSLSQPPALAVIASSTVSVQPPQMLPAPAVEEKRGGAVPRDSMPTGISKDGISHPHLRVVVLTMNRAKSLIRLLKSLEGADYLGDRADLDVWVDVSAGNGRADPATLLAAEQATWNHGIKTVHVQNENAGLKTQWITSWNASVPGGLRKDTPEVAIILEDDMEVSKGFWRWLKSGHAKYKDHPNVAGLTLQRASLCAAQCPDLKGGPAKTHSYNFFYPLVGSWGFSPMANHWVSFTKQWLPDFLATKQPPYVNGLTPSDWYRSFEKQGRCPGKKCMWTM